MVRVLGGASNNQNVEVDHPAMRIIESVVVKQRGGRPAERYLAQLVDFSWNFVEEGYAATVGKPDPDQPVRFATSLECMGIGMITVEVYPGTGLGEMLVRSTSMLAPENLDTIHQLVIERMREMVKWADENPGRAYPRSNLVEVRAAE